MLWFFNISLHSKRSASTYVYETFIVEESLTLILVALYTSILKFVDANNTQPKVRILTKHF